MKKTSLKHDLKNALISLETIALNLQDELYTVDQGVESLLSLKSEIEMILEESLETSDD